MAESLSFSVLPLIGRVDDAGSLHQSRGEPKQNKTKTILDVLPQSTYGRLLRLFFRDN